MTPTAESEAESAHQMAATSAGEVFHVVVWCQTSGANMFVTTYYHAHSEDGYLLLETLVPSTGTLYVQPLSTWLLFALLLCFVLLFA